MKDFQHKNKTNGILGAIDCSHIEIPKPSERDYVNRKGYHSLLLEITVDSNKKILYVYYGEPETWHDARVLRKSAIYSKITSNPESISAYFLIGDTAYLNLPWLVTLFKGYSHLSAQKLQFNYRIFTARVVVEQTFGSLKGRFRRLRILDSLDINLCTRIILGACVLHNIRINKQDFIGTDFTDLDQPNVGQHIDAAVIENQQN